MTDSPSSPDLDARLQAEIEEALGDMSLDDMMELADRPRTRKSERDVRTGAVVTVRGDDVFVEFGPKSQGLCALTDFDEPPAPGQTFDFTVNRYDEREGLLMLSRQGAVKKAEWESLEVGQFIEARCTGTNKGGLEMEVASHRAFMPAGQVDIRHVEDLNVFVGEKMPCEVIELDRQRGRIILSRRAAQEADRKEQREKLMADIKVGNTMPAVITSIMPYGAFADLGGADGLIHISDLSWSRIKHPSEVVKEGQQVQVQVLKIDESHDPPRIGLGMKQTMADPFESVSDELKEGATVSGRVTRIAPFGAFVEISPGVEGLIHISELSHERINRVESVVKPNEVVTAKVLTIDPQRQRISLSLKALKAEDQAAAPDRRDDPHMRKLMAQLGKKWGDNLKGGIG